MSKKVLSLVILSAVVIGTVAAESFPGLPYAVQAARERSTVSPTDTAACLGVSTELLKLVAKYPESGLVPEALYLAANLQRLTGRKAEALSLAQRVVATYPKSEFAPDAFDLAWNELTDNGATPARGADLAATLAVGLNSSSRAIPYYRKAFEGYRLANRWKDAARLGSACLTNTGAAALEPSFLYELADAALLAGESAAARQSLESLVGRLGDTPQIVAARLRLGQICESSGDPAAARENYSLAWTTFQKNRKNAAYAQPEVAQAAAEALWSLQTEARRDLQRLTDPDNRFDEKQARRQAEALTEAYEQVLQTDWRLAARANNAIGDVHTSLADALLKNGFRTSSASPTAQPPYYDALAEYDLAINAYTRAYEKANAGERSAENVQAARHAAESSFELMAGQGDAVFAWALDLFKKAPSTDAGGKGNEPRLQYIATTVAPLLAEGVRHKARALDLAVRIPTLSNEARALRQSLDLPLRPVASELAAINRHQDRALEAGSAQLAASFALGFQSTSSGGLVDDLEKTFSRAQRFAEENQKIYETLYAGLTACRLTSLVVGYWDSLRVTCYDEYTQACHALQSDLAVCSANLSVRRDEPSVALCDRLLKMQSKGASAELAGLTSWREFAARYNVAHPLNDRLEARLAEIDPVHYGKRDDIPSANRRKP